MDFTVLLVVVVQYLPAQRCDAPAGRVPKLDYAKQGEDWGEKHNNYLKNKVICFNKQQLTHGIVRTFSLSVSCPLQHESPVLGLLAPTAEPVVRLLLLLLLLLRDLPPAPPPPPVCLRQQGRQKDQQGEEEEEKELLGGPEHLCEWPLPPHDASVHPHRVRPTCNLPLLHPTLPGRLRLAIATMYTM